MITISILQYVLTAAISCLIGMLAYNAVSTTKVTDVLKQPSDTRSTKMIRQDAVMQLKNEIAKSSALKIKTSKKTGEKIITMKILK